jgi:hypothetical protein
VPEVILEALQGISGHFSSSTRGLEEYGFHFFQEGMTGGAVTDTSGRPIFCAPASNAPGAAHNTAAKAKAPARVLETRPVSPQ